MRDARGLKSWHRASHRSLALEDGVYKESAIGKKEISRSLLREHYEGRSTATKATVAGGADEIQIRTLLRAASLRGWEAATTEVKAAFLNAPRRNKDKMLLMGVPRIYKIAGLVEYNDEMWWICGAVYGLASSPRDWSENRDGVVQNMTWKRRTGSGTAVGGFERTSEDNLWKMVEYGTHADEEGNFSALGWFGEIKRYPPSQCMWIFCCGRGGMESLTSLL